MRKFLYGSLVIFLLITLSGLPALGYGGGGGGGGGGGSEGTGDPTAGMGPSTSGGSNDDSNPPAGFEPASPPGPFDPSNNSPFETHWDFEGEGTRDTGAYPGKSPEQRQREQEQVEWIKETTVSVGGSALLGWATGGYSIYVQIAASGAWAGGTTYYYSDGDTESSAEATIQDSVIAGLSPLGPIGSSIASPVITEIREQIPARPYRTRRQELEAMTPNFDPPSK
jgi:hypothetical protein